MLKALMILVFLAETCCWAPFTNAAEISVLDLDEGIGFAVLKGKISQGDAAVFNAATAPYKHVILVLDSPGGNLIEGLEIGRAVHQREMATGVAENMVCASACALIWAAGSYKAMAPNSLIGFHAAWENSDGETVVSSVGNALVGAYLQSIGFTETGIVFATIAGPDEINWMTIVDAQDAGLDVRLMDRNGKMIARSIPNKDEFKKLPLKLPTGYRWIVLESATSVSSLNKNAASALPVDLLKTVETKSGYFALIAGPLRREIAENILKEVKEIPRDAYLSSGNGFIRATH